METITKIKLNIATIIIVVVSLILAICLFIILYQWTTGKKPEPVQVPREKSTKLRQEKIKKLLELLKEAREDKFNKKPEQTHSDCTLGCSWCKCSLQLGDPRNKDNCIEKSINKSTDSVPFLPFVPKPTFPEPKARSVTKMSKGEALCKEVLEQMFGKKFVTVRPDILVNPKTNRNMELDCYNHELGFALEYNGIQHYVYPNFTNQSVEEFKEQLWRDELKKKLCRIHGIYLIIVPYTVKLTTQEVRSFIKERLCQSLLDQVVPVFD